jgi:hypothetical protein
VSRWHVLHLAASIVFVDFLRLTPCAGSGIVGTNATGLLTLRPDFVRVGSGVYDDEMSESSSSSSCSVSDGSDSCQEHAATHLALISTLGALPLAATSAPTPTSAPAPSSRSSRRRRCGAHRRRSHLSLKRARGPHSATPSSAGRALGWRRRRQLVASNVALQNLRLLGLKRSGTGRVA